MTRRRFPPRRPSRAALAAHLRAMAPNGQVSPETSPQVSPEASPEAALDGLPGIGATLAPREVSPASPKSPPAKVRKAVSDQ